MYSPASQNVNTKTIILSKYVPIYDPFKHIQLHFFWSVNKRTYIYWCCQFECKWHFYFITNIWSRKNLKIPNVCPPNIHGTCREETHNFQMFVRRAYTFASHRSSAKNHKIELYEYMHMEWIVGDINALRFQLKR